MLSMVIMASFSFICESMNYRNQNNAQKGDKKDFIMRLAKSDALFS